MKMLTRIITAPHGFHALRLLILLSPAFLCALPVSAQHFSESRRNWDEGPLTWDDFQGKPSVDEVKEKMKSSLAIGYYFNTERMKDHYRRYRFDKVNPYMSRYESWDSVHTDLQLLREQTLFDIAELYCRKATREALGGTTNFDDLFNYYLRQRNDRVKEMLVITDDGKDSVAVQAYYDDLLQELQREDYDPSMFPLIADKRGVSCYIGATAQIPSQRVFTPTLGMNMGFEFLSAKSHFGLGISLEGGGTSLMDVYTSRGPIYEGDAVTTGSIYAFYGRDVWRGGRASMTPLLGLGVGFCDLANTYGDESAPEVAGFMLMGGLLTDYIFRENINVPIQGYVGRDVFGLRLMPYVSLTNYGCGIRWTPSLNVSALFYFECN